MQSFLCSVFHVFNPEKWNGLEIKPAYVVRPFNTFPEIYRFPLYVKAFLRYKRKTKVFHFPCVLFSAYISRTLSRTVEVDILLESY